MDELTCLEICAGAGGQSLGLEQAGFRHSAAIEIDPDACQTLRLNRATWNVMEKDVRNVDGVEYNGIALLAGGVPCPPFSIAGKQLGADDGAVCCLKRSALSKRRKPRQSCSRTYVGWPVRA